MKKIILTTCSLLLMITYLSAQPVLSNIEKMEAGKTVKYLSGLNETQFEPGKGGAGVNWDFSHVTDLTDTMYYQYLNPSASQFPDSFPGSNLVRVSSSGAFEFYNIGTKTNELVGIIDTLQKSTRHFSKPIVTMVRPMSYLDSFNSLTIYKNDSVSGSYYSETMADGWGTLHLPGHTYSSVLRIRSYTSSHDTLPIGWVASLDVYNYSWYDPTHTFPVFSLDSMILKIDSNVIPLIFARFYNDIQQDIRPDKLRDLSLKIFVSNGYLFAGGDFGEDHTCRLTISDILGKTVHTQECYSIHGFVAIPAGSLPDKGQAYVITIESQGKAYSGKYLSR